MLPKIGCQYRAVTRMITPAYTWRPILAQNLAASTCFRHRYKADTGPSFDWRSINLNSRQRLPSSAQHLTDANCDTGLITITDCWLPRLSHYCTILSASVNRTWGLKCLDPSRNLGLILKRTCLDFLVSI